MKRARESLGIPLVSDSDSLKKSPDINLNVSLERKTILQNERDNISTQVETWEKSLNEYCKRNNLNFNELSENEINKATDVLKQKGFKNEDLEALLANTNPNSSLGRILNNTITHQVYDETKNQLETYLANGGKIKDVLKFFMKNEKSRHLDSMLALAREKELDNPLTSLLLLAKSQNKDYSNIG